MSMVSEIPVLPPNAEMVPRSGPPSASPIIEFQHVSKRFLGVQAVSEVDLRVVGGEVHALCGENGAGKSTLMKMLAQLEQMSEGAIVIDGKRLDHHAPGYARRLGIAMVSQELALAPHLTVTENLFLGRESGRFVLPRRAEARAARPLLERVGLHVDPRRLVSTLSMVEKQLVEIARALAVKARVTIFDEPTAVLTHEEIERLFVVIRSLKAEGIAVIYITHRLEEVFAIADRVTVMRDGCVVATADVGDCDMAQLIRLMVGRDVGNLYPKLDISLGEVLLKVEQMSVPGAVHDCSFSVHLGEILGFAGIIGAGRSELARAVFGAEPRASGRVFLDGADVTPRSPQEAIERGIAYVTEDRRGDGLAFGLSIAHNITLANLPSHAGLLRLRRERAIAAAQCKGLHIRTDSVDLPVELLSGGNQQKVLVARWLETNARVLIFDEPARGIDVAAKAEMFDLIGHLAGQGKAVILISSYLPELINMCDRILVMRGGRIAGEIGRADFSEERIVGLATIGAVRR